MKMLIEHIYSWLVIFVLSLCGETSGQAALSMNVTVVHAGRYEIKFNAQELFEFYSCLCDTNVEICRANITHSLVHDIVYSSQATSQQFSTVFYCELRPLRSIGCLRQPMSSCNCSTDCFVYQVHERTCPNGPVAVRWTQYISAIFDKDIMSVTNGNDSLCTAGMTTPVSPDILPGGTNTADTSFAQPAAPLIVSEYLSGKTENTNTGVDEGSSSDSNTGIIVGVLLGILGVIVIVLVALFIWKRNLLDRLPKLQNLMRRLVSRTPRTAEIRQPDYDDRSLYNEVSIQVNDDVVFKDNNNSLNAIQPNDGLEYWSNQSVNGMALVNPVFVAEPCEKTGEEGDYEWIQIRNGNDDGLVYEDGCKTSLTGKVNEADDNEDNLNYDAVYETSANVNADGTSKGLDPSAEIVADTSFSSDYANFDKHRVNVNEKELQSDVICSVITETYEDVDLQASKNNDLRNSLALALSERFLKNKAKSMVEIIHLPATASNSRENKSHVNQQNVRQRLPNETATSSLVEPFQGGAQGTNVNEYINSSAISTAVPESSNVYFELEKETGDYGLENDVADVIDEGTEEEFDYCTHSDV